MSEAPVVEQFVAPVDDPTGDTGGPIRGSLVWATWALFVGLGVMVAGAGLFALTVGIRAEGEGFPTVAIGAMSAGYYLGFLLGSRAALYVLTTVGHIRVYTALAAMLTVVILVSGMVVHPAAWIALRMLAGACLAGQYVVAESWLNQIVTNDQRARVLGFYTLVTVVPYGVGQLGVGVFDPATLTIFAVAAILISVAVTPVSLSAAAAPPLHLSSQKMTLRELFRLVPTGVITSLLVGIAHGAFIGLGAVYGARVGLSAAEVGVFVTMPTLGSLLLQIPIAGASDRIDRRAVGAASAAVAAAGAAGLLVAGADNVVGLAAMVLIGGTTYPLYSIAGAYTNDWVPAAAHRGGRTARRRLRRRCVRRPAHRLDDHGRRRRRRLRLDRADRPSGDRPVPRGPRRPGSGGRARQAVERRRAHRARPLRARHRCQHGPPPAPHHPHPRRRRGQAPSGTTGGGTQQP
ncbi:MAG: MFS transporter [Ilumatobacteraceae bacterium]